MATYLTLEINYQTLNDFFSTLLKTKISELRCVFKCDFKALMSIIGIIGTDGLIYLLLSVDKFVAKFSILTYNKRLLKITKIINGARICDSFGKDSVMTVSYVPVRSNFFYQLY